MASVDVESPFTNTPLQKTIDLCIQRIREYKIHVHSLSKDSICRMLTI